MINQRSLAAAVVVAGLSPFVHADVRLPAVISEHLVLQRESTVPLWGWAEPGERVTVTAGWSGEVVRTRADRGGEWRIEVKTGAAGGPHTLSFQGKNRIELEDVLLGEVWVCSGQSNMEWTIDKCSPVYDDLIPGADHPRLRVFEVARLLATTPQVDCDGTWQAVTPRMFGSVTAVGFFYGRELLNELDVPIGLISTNWGGTRAEAWTSDETLRSWRDFAERREIVRAQAANPSEPGEDRRTAIEAWWEKLGTIDPGSHDGWKDASFDDSSWRTQTVPSNWQGTDLAGFDGIVWMRREVQLPSSWVGQKLYLDLGPIDDQDTTYFNGAKVGGLQNEGHWTTHRRYEVPAELVRAGENVIAVRVYDSGGAGGLHGDSRVMELSAERFSRSIPLAGDWSYREGVARAQLPDWPRSTGLDQHYPSVLFNGMIAPLLPYAIRGAIWYQGESNRTQAYQYRELFPAMIEDWRAHWGQGEFPFYFVQIAPYGYGGDVGEAAELREAQMMTLRTPNTGMAVTMDIGDPADIHPRKKLEVGQRLARWALAKTYGKRIEVWSGPLYRGMALEDEAIRLYFEHVGGGLSTGGEAPSCFTIAGADRVFHPARARIDRRTIVVSNEAVPAPVAVRFAWGAADEPNLKNVEGLPASSFRTDDWPGVTRRR